MAREVDQEETNLDMTSMIDVVFLLIIFFILMPPKEMEGQLQSYLPQLGSGGKPDEKQPEKVTFSIMLGAAKQGKEVVTEVRFNNQPIGSFTTLSISELNRIYKLPERQKEELLAGEHKRDEEQFDPKLSDTLRRLLSRMIEAADGASLGRETDVMIDASSEVPFKSVLAVLNCGAGAKFKNLKFTAPDVGRIFRPD